jgi:ubiquinone/menaquinone biosynthesis C-methylase UbiE
MPARQAKDPIRNYSDRHLDPAQAAAYRVKFQRSFTRRLSTARETRLVAQAFKLALKEVMQPATMLDYPCGAGRFAPLFAGSVLGYIAGDHSPHMIAICTEVLGEAGLADRLIRTTEGDARAMNLEDNCVDLAASMRLLHHVPDRADRISILGELRRVSKGPLVTSFLDAASTKQKSHMRRCRKRGKVSRRVMLTPGEFEAEAAEAGWHVQQTWGLSNLFSGQRIALLFPAS